MKQRSIKEADRITAKANKWQSDMGLDWITVNHRTNEGVHPIDSDKVVETEAWWEYRTARMTWYLGKTSLLEDFELDEAIVHEFVHILNNPIESELPDKPHIVKHIEFATESLARVIIGVNNGRDRG